MSAPGFYGKLPLSGDFVSRGEDAEFVRFFDPWLARHIAPRIHEAALWPNYGLRFMLAPGLAGAAGQAGVILPSHDRSGRWFPLVCNAPVSEVSRAWAEASDDWFAELAMRCEAAATGEKWADELEVDMMMMTPPFGRNSALPESDMFLWCRGAQPIPCDPSEPEELLDALIVIDETGEVPDG